MSDHTPRARKSQQKTLGDQPVHIVTFTYRHYFNLDKRIPSTTLTFAKLVNTATFSFFALLHTRRAIYQLPSRTNNLRIYTA